MQIDFLLCCRALVVGDVNRTGEFDEALAEPLVTLFVANIVFDIPQGFVDRLEFRG